MPLFCEALRCRNHVSYKSLRFCRIHNPNPPKWGGYRPNAGKPKLLDGGMRTNVEKDTSSLRKLRVRRKIPTMFDEHMQLGATSGSIRLNPQKAHEKALANYEEAYEEAFGRKLLFILHKRRFPSSSRRTKRFA